MEQETRYCPECQLTLPDRYKRKYCSDNCLSISLERFWNKPRSAKKRWYRPQPEVRREQKLKHTKNINDNLLIIENFMMLGINLE